MQAQQVITAAEIVGDNISTPDNAVYAVRPISPATARHIGATPNASLQTAVPTNESLFTVRQDGDTVILDRHESQWSGDRVLVVVTPNKSGTQYSIIVNLRTETIESLVQLDRSV